MLALSQVATVVLIVLVILLILSVLPGPRQRWGNAPSWWLITAVLVMLVLLALGYNL